eukprot:m.319849 g.319849  ORF g.319849 m.319849 type:complete len:100 (-) comp23509_c0_seq1:23-322(-)
MGVPRPGLKYCAEYFLLKASKAVASRAGWRFFDAQVGTFFSLVSPRDAASPCCSAMFWGGGVCNRRGARVCHDIFRLPGLPANFFFSLSAVAVLEAIPG